MWYTMGHVEVTRERTCVSTVLCSEYLLLKQWRFSFYQPYQSLGTKVVHLFGMTKGTIENRGVDKRTNEKGIQLFCWVSSFPSFVGWPTDLGPFTELSLHIPEPWKDPQLPWWRLLHDPHRLRGDSYWITNRTASGVRGQWHRMEPHPYWQAYSRGHEDNTYKNMSRYDNGFMETFLLDKALRWHSWDTGAKTRLIDNTVHSLAK